MALPFLAGLGLTGLGFLTGRSSGGGAFDIASRNEIGTSKKQTITVQTDQRQFTTASLNVPNYTLIFNSPNSRVASSLSAGLSQSPTQGSFPSIIPQQGSGTLGGSASPSPTADLSNFLVIGGIVVGGFLLFSAFSDDKKKK